MCQAHHAEGAQKKKLKLRGREWRTGFSTYACGGGLAVFTLESHLHCQGVPKPPFRAPDSPEGMKKKNRRTEVGMEWQRENVGRAGVDRGWRQSSCPEYGVGGGRGWKVGGWGVERGVVGESRGLAVDDNTVPGSEVLRLREYICDMNFTMGQHGSQSLLQTPVRESDRVRGNKNH